MSIDPGGFSHLGFSIPVLPEKGRPKAGICSRCRRMRARTFDYGHGLNMCEQDVQDVVRVKAVGPRWRRPRQSSSLNPVEIQDPPRDDGFDYSFWSRYL